MLAGYAAEQPELGGGAGCGTALPGQCRRTEGDIVIITADRIEVATTGQKRQRALARARACPERQRSATERAAWQTAPHLFRMQPTLRRQAVVALVLAVSSAGCEPEAWMAIRRERWRSSCCACSA